AGLERLHEIRKLPGVADVGNGGGIARPAGCSRPLGEPLPYLLVAVAVRIELPADQVVLLDDHGALITVDRDGFGQAGPDARGRLDNSKGAVMEAQAGDRRV